MKTLKSLFLDELADSHDAEQRLCAALLRMIQVATAEPLRRLLQTHLREGRGRVLELEKVFECFGEEARSRKSKAIRGLLREGNKLISHNRGSVSADATILFVVQRITHYQIATYGCLRDWAGLLEHLEAACLLDLVLDEEKAADRRFNELARIVNREALGDRNGSGVRGGTARCQAGVWARLAEFAGGSVMRESR